MAINGIFILSELEGAASGIVQSIQAQFDPKLAAIPVRPHVTIAGSSGTGPVLSNTTLEELEDALVPIAAETPPLDLEFGPPERYMATTIVVLPLDPHGPIRHLHERIVRSGLKFEPSRFAFTPHCTLSMYPSHEEAVFKRILSQRVEARAIMRKITVYRTYDPSRATKLLELELSG